MQSRLHGARWVALLFLLTTVFFWKLGLSNHFTFLDSPDLTGQVLPWYEVQAKAWNDGTFPMWDPYVWEGQSLLGQMQPGSAFPLNWPLFAAPLGSDGHIRYRFIHIQRVLIHLLAALFAFLLARELEFSNVAAVFAGLAFTCGGWVGTVVWPQMLNGAIWLPLTLMLFHRAARQTNIGRGLAYAVLCGGSVGMSLLSGHHQAPFFSLLALGGIFVYLLIERMRRSRVEAISLAVLFGVVGVVSFVVAALQLFPAFEYGAEAVRWVGLPDPVGRADRIPFNVHHTLRMELVTLLGMVTPRFDTHVSTFVGWTALTLALYAVASSWKSRWVKSYALLVILALSYASGTYSALHGLAHEFIPEAHTARTAAYAIFVSQLAVFVLAACGLDRLMKQSPDELQASPWIRRGQYLLVGYAAMTYTALFMRALWGHMDPDPADNVMLSALIALVLAACLQGLKSGEMTAKVFSGAVLALLVFEMYGTQFYEITDIDNEARRTHINKYEERLKGPMEFLAKQSQTGPRFRYSVSPEFAPTNLGARYNLEQAGGFLASVNRDLFGLYSSMPLSEFYDLTNVKYFISRERRRGDQIVRYTAPTGISVFENPNAGPRAWMTYDGEYVSRGSMTGDVYEPLRPCGQAGTVNQTAWSIQSTTLEVRSQCAGFVVLADPFYSGWKATVDGVAVPIRRYRNALRAVYAPAGESTIEFRYEPESVVWGAWLTGFGFLLCFGAGAWLRLGAARN
jgi:uncharacterized membrane protein YfhO